MSTKLLEIISHIAPIFGQVGGSCLGIYTVLKLAEYILEKWK